MVLFLILGRTVLDVAHAPVTTTAWAALCPAEVAWSRTASTAAAAVNATIVDAPTSHTVGFPSVPRCRRVYLATSDSNAPASISEPARKSPGPSETTSPYRSSTNTVDGPDVGPRRATHE